VYHTLETEKQRYAVMQDAAAAVGRYPDKADQRILSFGGA
jgi:hypothetical protein